MHGFTRSPGHLSALARACTDANLACLRPALATRWAPTRMVQPAWVRTVAQRLHEVLAGLPGPVVLVGHSAGASVACAIVAQWLAESPAVNPTMPLNLGQPGDMGHAVQLAGLVLVDGVDSVTGLLRTSIDRLVGVPMVAWAADPGPCNRHGALADFLDDRRPGIVVRVPGSCHGDIEGVDRLVYRLACRERSTPQMRQAILEWTVQQATRMVDPPVR